MHGVSRLGTRDGDGDCDGCSRIACYCGRSRHFLNVMQLSGLLPATDADYARIRAITAEVLRERF